MATKVLGLEALRRKLRALAPAAKQEIVPGLRQSAEQIVTTQKSLAPVKSGDLRDSIHYTIDEDGLRATIEAGGPATTRPVRDGADASYDYALGQEFGTREQRAQPYFFPGYRANKKRAKSRISRAVTKAAKKVAAGGK